MIDPPKTKEEAAKLRYGVWGGEPNGHAFDPRHCAYEVSGDWMGYQCYRKPGHGPDGLYCKQHAKMVTP